jgi:hypothetical protein|tara:strand:- start:96 stop:242 length:147 start_codon:yes stop_codon:yes gene_type:complete
MQINVIKEKFMFRAESGLNEQALLVVQTKNHNRDALYSKKNVNLNLLL